MLMMFERGIRGGITHISNRYKEANNKYMKDYKSDKVVIIMFFLAQLNPYSPPIIPVISSAICHPFFPVYFLSFILYSPLSSPIFVHLFSDHPLSFTFSHTTLPHLCLFPVIYKLAVNFTPIFFQFIPSHFQTHIIVYENLMKNDKYYGSLRSSDNRWGEV